MDPLLPADGSSAQSLARFFGFAEASPYGMGMATLDGFVTYANPTLARLLGEESADKCGGKHFPTAYFSESTARRLREDILPALIRDGRWQGELEVQTADGREVPVDVNSFIIRDPQGQPAWLANIMTEITERKLAEAQLRISRERLRSTVAATPGCIKILSPDGTLLEMNDYGLRLLEADSAGAVVGTSVYSLIAPEHRESFIRFNEHICAGGTGSLEFEVIGLRGTRRWLETHAVPLRDPIKGQVLHLAITLDVTGRKQASEVLRQSEQSYREIFDSVTDAVFVHDATTGIIVDVNESMLRIYGYSDKKEVVGLHPNDIGFGESPYGFQEAMEWMRKALTEGLQVFEWCAHRKDGQPIWVEVALRSATINGCPRVLAVVRDATERRRTQAERERLQAQLIQAQKMESIGQLAGGVAHDFNNITAAIMMYLGLLQLGHNLDPETRQSLKELMEETKRAASLTRQLLLFSRRAPIELRILDLNKVVTHLLKMLRRLIGENVDLRFEDCPGLPPVQADSGMMEQVLMNLCVNARDAMPRGGTTTIHLSPVLVDEGRAREHGHGSAGTFVRLSVSDTGSGMDTATVERIFEPFFTTKEVGRGTGLGLATVHGIVAQHKGWIEVESHVGRGTRFDIFFPATQPQAEDAESTEEPVLSPGHEKIMVVEDEASLRGATVRSLKLLGYNVLEASNAAEALGLWNKHGPSIDLLLTDMIMPGSASGRDLANSLHQMKPELKVIIVSGYEFNLEPAVHPGDAKQHITHLQKPYRIEGLSRILRECLER